MITKISKIGQNIYSVNDSDIPLDSTSIINLGINLGVNDTEKLIDTLDKKGSIEIKTAEKGTVVNVYEVEYPTPKDPNKETQEMAQYLDEYEDFITQNLFPGVESEDIVITTEESLEANKSGPGRLFTEKELSKRPVLKQSSKGRKYIKLYKTALFGPDIEIYESDSDEIKLYKKILRIARGINHNGDYGDVFYKPDEKKIWWVSADGDGDPSEGSDTSDMIKEKFLALDEVNNVIVEAESYPNEEGWIGIKQEIIPVIEKREIKKEGWRVLPDADYDPAKEKGWGWERSNKVEREDVIRVGNKFFQFIKPIRSTQLQAGNIYGSSYYEFNSGYDIFKFKGFSYTPDATGPEVASVRELLQTFGVRSLKVLDKVELYLNWKSPDVWRRMREDQKAKVNEFFKEYPKFLKLDYIPELYMWMDWYDERNNTWEENVDYFYLFEGRWARGSGAEKLTFWEVEEVAPSPNKFGWREILC